MLTLPNTHIFIQKLRPPNFFFTCLFHTNRTCTCKYPEHKEKLLKSLRHYLYPEGTSHNLYALCQILSVKAKVIIRKYERCHFWQVVRWFCILSCNGIKIIPKKSTAGYYFTSSIYVKHNSCHLYFPPFGILVKDSCS